MLLLLPLLVVVLMIEVKVVLKDVVIVVLVVVVVVSVSKIALLVAAHYLFESLIKSAPEAHASEMLNLKFSELAMEHL